jgi:glutathione S-transferase
VRHKERKFGRGCLEQWRKQQKDLLVQFDDLLLPCEEMLFNKPFLLGHNPLFLDFNLFGMLGNFLYSGHYKIPARHTCLMEWYGRMRKLKFSA